MRDGAQDPADLARLAASIADGLPLDWAAERRAGALVPERLETLRLIESIGAAHRRLGQRDPDAGRPLPGSEGESTHVAPGPGPVLQPPAAETWGHLRIVDRIGGGGFADVYRAFDPILQREVALKLPRADREIGPETGDRFLQEARRLARVRHPNIVTVYGAERHDGRVGLWTELLRGRTLEQIVTAEGPFGAHEVACIGVEISRALAAVHAEGLIHGDVKTGNVVREPGGRIVLMDFGSAMARRSKSLPGEQEPASGTPLFMPPEELLHGKPAAPSSDIYSLGVLLFRLLTGRFPVEAEDPVDLRDRLVRNQRLSLRDLRPDLPSTLVSVIGRALDHDPRRRYPGASDLERALVASIEVDAAGSPPRTSPERRLSRLILGAMGLAVLIAVAVAGVVFYPRPASGPPQVEADLLKVDQGTAARLGQGARVTPGDRLIIELQSREPVHVYVLTEDEKGEAFVLFPADFDLDNPLGPGNRHRLPGKRAGEQMTWQVTSAGGTEGILVIASRRPLDDLVRDVATIPRAREGRDPTPAPLTRGSLERLRGIGGLAQATAPLAGTRGLLVDLEASLSTPEALGRGIWTHRFTLANP